MAASFFVTAAVAQGFLAGTGLAEALATSPLIKIYSGSVPADADATNAGTLLATLTCSATPLGTPATTGTAPTRTAAVSFAAIASATAVATGTASFFDITTSGGTVIARGNAGTISGYSLILNTASVTTGSTVAITAATISMLLGA